MSGYGYMLCMTFVRMDIHMKGCHLFFCYEFLHWNNTEIIHIILSCKLNFRKLWPTGWHEGSEGSYTSNNLLVSSTTVKTTHCPWSWTVFGLSNSRPLSNYSGWPSSCHKLPAGSNEDIWKCYDNHSNGDCYLLLVRAYRVFRNLWLNGIGRAFTT